MRTNRAMLGADRRRRLLATGTLAALLATALSPAPGSAVTPEQGYQLESQFVVGSDDGLAANPATGDVYVTDSDFERVRRYSAAGTLLGSVDVQDAGGIAVGPLGWVYVVDYDGVAVFHPDLSPIGRLSVENVGLTDVAVNAATGDVYVTDVVDDEVVRYSASGAFLGRWGSSGSGQGQLDNPQSIAVGPGGDVYVGERWNNRVSRFGPTGSFLGAWGQAGTGNGAFQWPIGLATDAQGNVYVADHADTAGQGGRIQIFTAGGGYLASIGAFGSPPFGLFGPEDIEVDPRGRVQVLTTDASANDVVATYAPVVPTGPGPGAGTGKAKVVKPKGAVKLRGKRLRIAVKCVEKRGRCTGQVVVRAKGRKIAKPKAYSIKPGRKKSITVKVTKAGRKVLRKKAVATAIVKVHGGKRKIRIRR